MKTKVFFLALVAALGFSTMQAGVQVKTNDNKMVKPTYVAGKHAIMPFQFMTPTKAISRADVPEGYAEVTLTAGDLWDDGSGYQLLLDADANTYGTIIPETGPMNTGGNVDDATYAEFEFKIPEDADGSLTTSNMVMDNSITILIPAGVYDYVIVNPTPGDRMWIASNNGPTPAREDNYEFISGLSYEFVMDIYGSNDGCNLKILEPGVALTLPTDLTVDPGMTTANVSWNDDDDMMWNLRYRVYNPNVGGFWDFEDDTQLEGWLIYDGDGDGYNWYYSTSSVANSGEYVLASDSYYYGALEPDNWLISPEVALNGELSFFASGSSSYYYDENFSVYYGPADWETVDEFVPLQENIVTGYGMQQYTFDLSGIDMENGVIAIRHHNCYDVYTLLIDDFKVGEEPNEWIEVNGLEDVQAVLEGLSPETTYEVQVQACGNYTAGEWTESVLFTTLGDAPIPTDLTAAPTFNGYTTDGIHAYFVEIVPTEPSVIYYRVLYNGELVSDWAVYEDILSFTQDGQYRVEAYAVADGKLPSYEIAYEFVVSPATGLVELDANKTVANVRYFNMAGQEMSQANGMTIVVTTYTDGTTNTSKVVK